MHFVRCSINIIMEKMRVADVHTERIFSRSFVLNWFGFTLFRNPTQFIKLIHPTYLLIKEREKKERTKWRKKAVSITLSFSRHQIQSKFVASNCVLINQNGNIHSAGRDAREKHYVQMPSCCRLHCNEWINVECE